MSGPRCDIPPTSDRSARSRGLLWVAGLVVALGAGATTAHGLFEVAVAATVPVAVAWLYPVITDGLALVAYASTARLTTRPARRYAWTVVVVAAGLSGLAQATYLAGAGPATASVVLRFGIGAWPAIAAATVAHLLYLIGGTAPPDVPAEPGQPVAAPVPVEPVPASDPTRGKAMPVRVEEQPTSTPQSAPVPGVAGREAVRGNRSSQSAGRSGRAARSDAELLAQLTARGEPMSVRAAARELGTGPDRARRLLRQTGLLATHKPPPDHRDTARPLHVVHDRPTSSRPHEETADDTQQDESRTRP